MSIIVRKEKHLVNNVEQFVSELKKTAVAYYDPQTHSKVLSIRE